MNFEYRFIKWWWRVFLVAVAVGAPVAFAVWPGPVVMLTLGAVGIFGLALLYTWQRR